MKKIKHFATGLRSIISKIFSKVIVAILFLAVAIITFWAIQPSYAPSWTGFEVITLWDWLDLLIVPIFVTFGVWWLDRLGKAREQSIEADNHQEAALENYFDKLGILISAQESDLTKDSKLVAAAKSRTHILLPRLNGERKAWVIKFLCDAGLINAVDPIIVLFTADLRGAYFDRMSLNKINLCSTDLTKARFDDCRLQYCDFSEARLFDAWMGWANLSHANMQRAFLSGADLHFAKLMRANLTRAHLDHALLDNAELQGACLKQAFMPNVSLRQANLACCTLEDACMDNADLRNANLTLTNLRNVSLRKANLSGAILDKADLRYADLTGAKISYRQLSTVKSLQWVILPDSCERYTEHKLQHYNEG